MSGSTPAAARTFNTPIWAQPRAAPPPRAMPILGLLILPRWKAHAETVCRLTAANGHVRACSGLAECDELAAANATLNSLRFPLRHQHDHRSDQGRIGAPRRRSAATDRRRSRRGGP